MAVCIRVFGGKACYDNIGLELPHHPNHVRENFFSIPNVKRFLRRFREAEIIRSGEKLLAVIDAPRGEQLLSANDSKLVA